MIKGNYQAYKEYLKDNKNSRSFVLYWDIETLQYNQKAGMKKPTEYKNVTYSVAIGFEVTGKIEVVVFPSFREFFEVTFDILKGNRKKISCNARIDLIAHNNNKYDNHYLLHDLLYFYDVTRENVYLKNAIDNNNTIKMKDAKQIGKSDNIVLEKRVKSSINLDLEFWLKGVHFKTIDNFMKTTTSIATLGKKLKDLKFLTDDELKTEFDYEVFNRQDDMTEATAHEYAYQCFKTLDDKQMTYIFNDVIILGQSHIHYEDLFPNFDYSKITFSMNILDSYLINDLTQLQLLNKFHNQEFINSKYRFGNDNYYDYIKSFYRGGLNMYNSKYVGKIVNDDCFSIDINSSYPYVMYHEKIPTFLKDYDIYNTEQFVSVNTHNQDIYTLFRMSKESFNIFILNDIKSELIKQVLVKYYSNHDYVNINTFTLKLIERITDINIKQIPVISWINYDCEYFGAREVIHENYFIKTQGKLKNKIDMRSPYDYTITNEKNTIQHTPEEVLLSKTVLNGLYGIPALRSHFNLFRLNELDEIENTINGYKNNERNILFSTFVTSVALFNLLKPLFYLTQSEIDDAFIYCDTDSLYLKKYVKDKLPSELFDKISLGKWDIENETIKGIYVLNHKKYAYYSQDDKSIHVKSGGIPHNAFNTNMSFNEFINTQFYDGAYVKNLKSIYNRQGTISLYPSTTKIDKGLPYPNEFREIDDERRNMLIKRLQNELSTELNDFMYIESELGTFSQLDIFKPIHEYENKITLNIYRNLSQKIREIIQE